MKLKSNLHVIDDSLRGKPFRFNTVSVEFFLQIMRVVFLFFPFNFTRSQVLLTAIIDFWWHLKTTLYFIFGSAVNHLRNSKLKI